MPSVAAESLAMPHPTAVLPPFLVLDSLLKSWLLEDIGRGDRTAQSLFPAGVPIGRPSGSSKKPELWPGYRSGRGCFTCLIQPCSSRRR